MGTGERMERGTGKLAHIFAAAIGGALGAGLPILIVLFNAGAWKGSVDESIRQLTATTALLQERVDRVDSKIDRLAETVANRR